MDRSKWKRGLALFLITIMMVCGNGGVIASGEENEEKISTAEDVLIQAPAGILMEAGTGTMLYEKGDEEKRSPASITKIMTLLLIFDSMSEGNLKLTDTVTTSAYAKSMGGSQVFLEEGETQDVETMIKCIVIASGNDASVAMAEHIAGSEQEFVKRMNQRAEQLGMNGVTLCSLDGVADRDFAIEFASACSILMMHLSRMSEEINQKYGFERAFGKESTADTEITKIGIAFNDDGTTSFFAELEKSSAKQRERIEEAREEKRTEKKAADKKAEKELQSYAKSSADTKRTVVQADSMEELIKKIGTVDWENVKAEKTPENGSRFDYSI